MPAHSPPPVTILNVPIHPVTMPQTLALVAEMMTQPGVSQIATPNPEFVMRAQQEPAFMALLQRTALNVPDGVGLLYAARWLNRPVPQRVPGSDLVYALAAQAALHGWPLFLLGAAPGVAAEAADRLQQRYAGLQVVGTYAGSPARDENDAIVAQINASGAKLLYVAYGAPRQDFWIDRNRAKLTHVRVAMGIGGALDFITGRATRAPRWVQRLNLEWLHRLIKEPWRWRRMLALPRFAWRVLWARWRQR